MISVIIPHYQDLARLDLCLSDLQRQTLPREAFEIVVADNASPAGEAAVAKVIAGRARLVICHTPGAGPARNAAVAASSGATLAFIDADCRPEPEWLASGLEALRRHDFVGGRVVVLVDEVATMTPFEAFEAVFAFDNKTYVEAKGFTVTANLFAPRQIFDAVGGFRPDVSEDKDWSHRARDQGFRIGYAAKAVVGHPARRTWSELIGKWRRLNSESFALMMDRPGGRGRWLLRALILPASAVAHTPKVLLSPALHSWKQRLKALTVLYQLRLWRTGHALRLLCSAPVARS